MIKPASVAVVLVALFTLGACGNSDGAAVGESSSTAPAGKRQSAPLGNVELPPLEFAPVDDSGTVAAGITSEALFDLNSAELKPAAQTAVDQIAAQLAKEPASVRVDGFTDGLGRAAHNLELSQKRADALAEKISELGTAEEVQSCGRGEERTDGESEDPAARRVIVTISVEPLPGDCK